MPHRTLLRELAGLRPNREMVVPGVVAASLVVVANYNFLLFHTLVELFAICIAVLMCVVAWQSYPFSRNGFLMFLACGYFWVGSVDMIHTLAYKGMGLYPIDEANAATQLWITARYMEAALLFLAPFFFGRAVGRRLVFSVFGAIAAAAYFLVMSGYFPDAFIEGQGLTPFKIYSEYIIIAILGAAIVHLAKKSDNLDPHIFFLLAASIVLTMIAELAFTFYIHVFGLSNLVGHIFKFFSYWLILRIIVRSTVLEPYMLLEQRIEQLNQSNKELEMFAHVASHDLKEPLRMIASYTQLLGDRYGGRLDETADRYIRYAVDGAKRMNVLVDNLLAYSQIDKSKGSFEPTDCGSVVDEAIKDHQLMISEARAAVIHGDLPTVMADRRQLVQLFQNLIDNALKFRGEAPPMITIGAVSSGAEWEFFVKDNGIGVDPAYFEKIFELFQRLHDRNEYSGTGLGLALCKKIVEEHGGRIWLESKPGSGSTFFFTLHKDMGF